MCGKKRFLMVLLVSFFSLPLFSQESNRLGFQISQNLWNSIDLNLQLLETQTEDMQKLPHFSIGEISVEAGAHKITLPDITNIVEGAVLEIGNHTYQIKALIGNVATLDHSEDGDRILEDFSGEIFMKCPIRIGYYDQNLKLPSVILWYSSPTPDLRAIRREEYRVFGNEAYIKEKTQCAM